jgi:GH25 family lysozyme M1 (1,4-beta-N-acetylmuramidase)
MLYQAKVIAKAGAFLYPWPLDDGEYQPIVGELAPGTLVDVLHLAGAGAWALISTAQHAGWLSTGQIKKIPWILIDLYRKDWGGKPPIAAMIQPGFHGILLKATQGTKYPIKWFLKHWPLVKLFAGERYGHSFARGAYCYLEFYTDPIKQAAYYLDVLDDAGGWDVGDICPIVDVENGKDTAPNHNADATRVIEVTTAFAHEVTRVLKRPVMLYGGSAIRDRKIKSHMGCSALWTARYGPKLPASTYEKMGWKLALTDPQGWVWGWQYAGDAPGTVAGLPFVIPGVGANDLSVSFAPTFADLLGP